MATAAAEALPPEVGSELRTRYRQLRVMLHAAGLAATYAFIVSKAKDTDPLAGPGQQDKLGAAYQTAVGWNVSPTPRSSATDFKTSSDGVNLGFVETPSIRLA